VRNKKWCQEPYRGAWRAGSFFAISTLTAHLA
jgi:hypothetical protein